VFSRDWRQLTARGSLSAVARENRHLYPGTQIGFGVVFKLGAVQFGVTEVWKAAAVTSSFA
jgi:hypothetical protein